MYKPSQPSGYVLLGVVACIIGGLLACGLSYYGIGGLLSKIALLIKALST